MLPMLHAWEQFLFRSRITAKLIGDQYPWHVLTALQQLAEELFRGPFISPALHQDIQNIPLLIDRTPQIVLPAIDFEEHLIKMPFVAGSCTSPAQLVGIVLPKARHHWRTVS